MVDPKDVAMLEDLIVAATNAALRAVQTLVQSEGGPLANLKSMFPGMMP
ncbi:MAG: YbaB/EbfC family nucleoid-associated protein [Myxococcales bacterium]